MCVWGGNSEVHRVGKCRVLQRIRKELTCGFTRFIRSVGRGREDLLIEEFSSKGFCTMKESAMSSEEMRSGYRELVGVSSD